ncbi:MAG: hypothetical protein GXY65_16370 [Rhodococcus sp.]|uniref:hypothetical protein n=1 Tax=Rhodococcus TaxID=1827 RepID=UPI00169FAFC4|nr:MULTISPECIES: hypothetical protein [Rhodococcus]NLV80881.1 hypothetical protein [Rhodococcus sp. (in: high G+C Gram-positive bacteria)]
MSTSIPRPGEHLPGARPGIDPTHIHGEIDRLLGHVRDAHGTGDAAEAISRQSALLEQAHDVLVEALSTVDRT